MKQKTVETRIRATRQFNRSLSITFEHAIKVLFNKKVEVNVEALSRGLTNSRNGNQIMSIDLSKECGFKPSTMSGKLNLLVNVAGYTPAQTGLLAHSKFSTWRCEQCSSQ
jgi:hypothetical protein